MARVGRVVLVLAVSWWVCLLLLLACTQNSSSSPIASPLYNAHDRRRCCPTAYWSRWVVGSCTSTLLPSSIASQREPLPRISSQDKPPMQAFLAISNTLQLLIPHVPLFVVAHRRSVHVEGHGTLPLCSSQRTPEGSWARGDAAALLAWMRAQGAWH
jgi:hypothetical protein